MSDLHIRCAAPSDIDTVLQFWRTAAEGTSISDDYDGVARLLARDPEALLLAERDGLLTGTVIAGFDGWRCSAYRLAVHPDCRRQGIATALLDAVERRFAALGGRRVDAMVLEANERAHHAWAAAGYRREDHWRRWVPHCEHGVAVRPDKRRQHAGKGAARRRDHLPKPPVIPVEQATLPILYHGCIIDRVFRKV